MITIPEPFTREDLIRCVDRESHWRERVYPRRVELGKLSLAGAIREKRMMSAIRAVLEQLPPTQAALFADATDAKQARP